MIKINLISDNQKNEREVDKKLGIIIRLGMTVVFSMLSLAVIMISARIILGINLNSVKEGAKKYPDTISREIQQTENLLREIDSISKKTNKISQDILCWGRVIKTIAGLCPDGIKISNIHIEKEHVKISGFSKSREDFIFFQDSLKRKEFENLNSPISNFVSRKDFSFFVEFDVNKEFLNEL